MGEYTLLARCAVPLAALVKSNPKISGVNFPIFSVQTNQVIAHISFDVRLALPVSELFNLFLERHPMEKRHIEEISTRRAVETANAIYSSESGVGLPDLGQQPISGILTVSNAEDEVRLYNELEIAIIKATGLPMSADGQPPTAFVHFQLLGHPDQFTNPVPSSNSPEFKEKFTFPIITSDQQLRLLHRSRLHISVVDLKGEELDQDNEGLIGEVEVLSFNFL